MLVAHALTVRDRVLLSEAAQVAVEEAVEAEKVEIDRLRDLSSGVSSVPSVAGGSVVSEKESSGLSSGKAEFGLMDGDWV